MTTRRATAALALGILATATLPALAAEVVVPDGHGGGAWSIRDLQPELTEAQRDAIRAMIRKNQSLLREKGLLPPSIQAVGLRFDWPLRPSNGLADYGYHGISNFVDHDPSFPDWLLDYECGQRTYDLPSGYNHAGTDFFTWPFGWWKMDHDQVIVVAAAPGTIVAKSDGNDDRSCGLGGGDWNAVYVQHADGSVAWYGHMKNGSPTSKPVGATVEVGEYLGVVGSSGNSTGPHLHFEVYDALDNLIDPWTGTCNDTTFESWWLVQRPYYDSAINEMTTGGSAPSFPACPLPESAHDQVQFARGSTIYFTTYYRDQLNTQPSTYTIRRPDGTAYAQWNHNSDAPYYAASWWYWYFNTFAPSGPDGLWRFEVSYQGKTYLRTFNIGGNPAGRVGGDYGAEAPLTVDKLPGGDVSLAWSPSCRAGDGDYEVYEGALGAWYSHQARTCSTGGATTTTVTPFPGGRYFLVVPQNGSREGSYGMGSGEVERPVGAGACLPRELGACL